MFFFRSVSTVVTGVSLQTLDSKSQNAIRSYAETRLGWSAVYETTSAERRRREGCTYSRATGSRTALWETLEWETHREFHGHGSWDLFIIKINIRVVQGGFFLHGGGKAVSASWGF